MIKTLILPIRTVSWLVTGMISGAILTGGESFAANLDTIGVTALRASTTNLNGAGVHVAHVEAELSNASPSPFEVSPGAVGLPSAKFSYFVGPPVTLIAESANGFPNSIGAESSHSDNVASLFYGIPGGVSTNVAQVDNYEANYFFNTFVPTLSSMNDSVVNQSFAAAATVSQQQTFDSDYDNYAAVHSVLFVSSVGNTGPVSPPSTCYNGLGVGAYGGGSNVGPTPDNGRAKPDITAPGVETSFSAPLVSGAATIIFQAGTRGDGGGDTTSATDPRLVKALLINGAVKPAGWLNPSPSPLDPRYGAGIVNVLNSYRQLAGGKHAYVESHSVSVGAAHPPLSGAGNVSGTNGWDLNTISSSPVLDGVNHYYFDLTGGAAGALFTGTMSLVWNRQVGQSSINDLDLFLYDTASGNLIASSTSAVDNVEHIYFRSLPPGRYDLQVLKHGGSSVSTTETYALAFEFFTMPLSFTASGSTLQLTWPSYPNGFRLESTGNLSSSPAWSATFTPVLSGNQYTVTVNTATGNQFFRLVRP